MQNLDKWRQFYQVYKPFTMVWEPVFWENLNLCTKYHQRGHAVVECGVWKGGMIAAIASAINDPQAEFHLFDSFQGLPPAREIDGEAAMAWQQNKASPDYLNNCTASLEEAREAMALSGAEKVIYHEGWFSETLPAVDDYLDISILRLDADWYESTLLCLDALYPKVVTGGLIIIDDYHTWDGCCRAVHDYFSRNSLTDRIRTTGHDVAYIIKS